MIQKKHLIILVIIINGAWARHNNNVRFDSLAGKSFEYLQMKFENSIYDNNKSKIYSAAWLQKAKAEKGNYHQLALAYRAFAINADKSTRLFYADSMISNAKRTTSNELLASSYMAKGIIHYNRNEHMAALDNYLIADSYITQVNIPHLNYQIKYGIALIKYYLGFYDEAISLLHECVVFYREENDRAYLNSQHALALCYTRIGKYQLASQTNLLAIEEGRQFEDTAMEGYFIHSEGINQCHIGNYTTAIQKLNAALPKMASSKDHANEAVAYFYIGQSYWSLRQYENAVTYFKKVDNIFQKEKYMLPELRKGYEYLIDYHKLKNDTKSQLFYIDQLLKVDSLLAQDYKYLLKKIVKEYDTKELLAAKKAIENTILFTRITAGMIVLAMSMAIILLIRRNKRNVKLFEELMKRDTSNYIVPSDVVFKETEVQNRETIENNSNGMQTKPEISKDIEAAIVKRLEKFELNKKYLEKDMTLARMATILHTNSKYVTKVIAKHRGKGTIEYITELKLDYIVEMLKTSSRFRNYTNAALAEEAGFRTTQHFTRAFKRHTGITPNYFSNKLKKAIAADNPQ
ncbi:helix-turn-helix domain-containing protein [Flavobacterium sp.]|uniref:helix-turn-helix domain-containing protein n=1 Tax=Flavobacterium sp. TaxID=239 RepID=UPI003919E84C